MDAVDLSNTTFTPARLREGYDSAEVDRFVAAAAESIIARDAEIRELRHELAGKNAPSDIRDGSVAAARLLELASTTADQLVAEAKAEAGALLSTAHTDAEQLTTAAQAEADQILAGSRNESERVAAELSAQRAQQEAELDQHRTSVLAEVGKRQAALESEVARLKQLETETRTHLQSYFSEQLDQVSDHEAPVALSVVGD